MFKLIVFLILIISKSVNAEILTFDVSDKYISRLWACVPL